MPRFFFQQLRFMLQALPEGERSWRNGRLSGDAARLFCPLLAVLVGNASDAQVRERRGQGLLDRPS